MNRKTWTFSLGAAALAVLAFAWAFAPRPVAVETATARLDRFEAGIEEDGKTRVRDRFILSAPLAGSLSRIALREGDSVVAGTPVATLLPMLPPLQDERTLQAQQAQVEIAIAGLQRSQARTEAARVAQQQARNELQSSEALARQGYVAETKLDRDRLMLKAAQQDLEAATQERHAAEHQLEQARAALGLLQHAGGSRAFTVRAPVDGRVLRVIQGSEATVALGAPLLELGDTRRMEVVAELLTTEALKAVPGSPVVIERWGGDGALEGQVRLVEPGAFTKVSALGVEEQRVRVLVDLTSPPDRWSGLGDGYRVGVRIVVRQSAQALQVPVGAVFPRPDGPGAMAVYLLRDGRARLQPVELVARNGSAAWVRSGLKPGDEVVVYPPASLADGARVKRRAA